MWLLHGTSESDWTEIKRSGGLRNPYLTKHEPIAWYFAEESSAIGKDNAPALLRVDLPDTDHLEADLPMFQEPIVEAVEELGYKSVSAYHRAVRAGEVRTPKDRQDWRTSLEVIGCVRYRGIITPDHISIYERIL